ncbi:MAG TPA: MBL fold metallo-hydrolase [Geobacteraceae bacterium]|nr:MBL fold metallo-hydrolase [Geobacteraceae bacterium]
MGISKLVCIDLDQPQLEGFRQFISSWLCVTDSLTVVVDPGPLSTIPRLVNELRQHGVSRIDYILLTHIHIDHAGGAGALLREFPGALVICHPEGIRHMITPEKLWEGSRKVLGPLAEAYGEIVPIPAESILFSEDIGEGEIRAFLTPGHAQHHCCYLVDDLLFGGEVAGVRCELPGDAIFIRPATPPRFILEVALDSIDRMIALRPRRLVFAHYGVVESAVEHLTIAREQLLLWVRSVAVDREEKLVARLTETDPYYRNVTLLPEDIGARERYFLGNTLKGMAEYVDALPEEGRRALRGG